MAATLSTPESSLDLRSLSNASNSGVSWGAIFAGSAAAASLTLILLILGFGLGLSSISPWSGDGVSAETFGISTIVWLTFTLIASSGIGGYLAGRLRVKWVNIHTDEVYFRDTAHGMLAWAVASLVTVALLTSALSSVVSSSVKTGATVLTGATAAAGAVTSKLADGQLNPNNYYLDSLFRSEQPAPVPIDNQSRIEVATIFLNSLKTRQLSPEDKSYVGRIISRQTGLSQADAERRVTEVSNRLNAAIADTEKSAKQAADNARKAVAYSSLWMFIAMLCGAFFASLAATFGGKQRDKVV